MSSLLLKRDIVIHSLLAFYVRIMGIAMTWKVSVNKLLQLSDEFLSSSLVLITSILYNLANIVCFLCNLLGGASNIVNSGNLELWASVSNHSFCHSVSLLTTVV